MGRKKEKIACCPIPMDSEHAAMMASTGGFDLGFVGLPSNVDAFVGSITMDSDDYVRCTNCGYGGCDVRVNLCGCTFHAVSVFLVFCSHFG